MVKAELNESGQLTAKQIAYIINSEDLNKFTTNDAYYAGNNQTILEKENPTDPNFPNNRITVPYGRKIAKTTINYMFSRDIVYNAEDNEYMTEINNVFIANNNQDKKEDIGEDLIVFGVAYLLYYFSEDDGEYPRYMVVDGKEIIPIYDYSIEPKLIAAIRYYHVVDNIDAVNTKTKIEVYYKYNLVKYEIKGADITESNMMLQEDRPHGFKVVPLAVYGDEYKIGVFEPVIKIIDAIDNITSQNMNEIDKFELAYLVLTGQTIAEDDKNKIKEKRFFELEAGSTLDYLTKKIDGEFRGDVISFLVEEVHKQSGVPDFASKDFAAESGVALLYKLMGFENLAASYEKIFIRGEKEAINIINNALYGTEDKTKFIMDNPQKEIKVTMFRNLPEDVKARLEEAKLKKEIGISDETILDGLPFVEDVETELKKMAKQSEDNFNRFQKMQEKQNSENIDDKTDDNDNQE